MNIDIAAVPLPVIHSKANLPRSVKTRLHSQFFPLLELIGFASLERSQGIVSTDEAFNIYLRCVSGYFHSSQEQESNLDKKPIGFCFVVCSNSFDNPIDLNLRAGKLCQGYNVALRRHDY